MAADLTLLAPELQERVTDLLARCRTGGVEMRPNEGLRDPLTQARYWRQSRSTEQIRAETARLRAAGAEFLARCIEFVGPQHGPQITGAIPGLSWHQWGEALDCFWVVNGAAEWSTRRLVAGVNGYSVYAKQAESVGLNAGGHWARLKDWPHIQLRQAGSPLSQFALPQISQTMEARFSHLL